MTDLLNFEENFLFYQQYHQNFINKIIHIICIPLITWSLSVLLLDIKVFNTNLSSILLTFYKLYYIIISFKYGLLMFFILEFIYRSSKWFRQNTENYIQIALLIQAITWILQFIGHGVFEGKRPALMDSLLQAFLMAPIFVIKELLEFF